MQSIHCPALAFLILSVGIGSASLGPDADAHESPSSVVKQRIQIISSITDDNRAIGAMFGGTIDHAA